LTADEIASGNAIVAKDVTRIHPPVPGGTGNPAIHLLGGGSNRNDAPVGYDVDHTRIKLGEGEFVFRAASAALRCWEQFRLGWVEAWSPDTPIQSGAVVAVMGRAFGMWWLNAWRIVYVVEASGPITKFGFAYGTLPGHVESGEERFLIEWDRDSGSVSYDILAFSKPNHLLTRLGYPVVRRLQKRSGVTRPRRCSKRISSEHVGDTRTFHSAENGTRRLAGESSKVTLKSFGLGRKKLGLPRNFSQHVGRTERSCSADLPFGAHSFLPQCPEYNSPVCELSVGKRFLRMSCPGNVAKRRRTAGNLHTIIEFPNCVREVLDPDHATRTAVRQELPRATPRRRVE